MTNEVPGFDFFGFKKDNIGSNKGNQAFVGTNQNNHVVIWHC
jgi:hypothetical protein